MKRDRQRFLLELAILIIMLAICIFMLAKCLEARSGETAESNVTFRTTPPPVATESPEAYTTPEIKEVPVYVEVNSPDEEYYKAYHRAFHELLTGWTGVDEYGREVILANANSDIEKTAFCDAINDFNGIAEQAWSDGAEQGAYEAAESLKEDAK